MSSDQPDDRQRWTAAHELGGRAPVPRVATTLIADGRLPGGWERDFTLNGALHLRRLQAEAIRQYVTQVPIQARQTSVTEVFEQVAGWVAETYPWGT